MKSVLVALLGMLMAGTVLASERADVAWQQIDDGAVVIDVRTPQEFAGGHIKGAHNIEYQNIASGVAALKLNRTQPVVVYCRSGNRSGIAEHTLLKMGYNVHNGGGLQEMLQAEPQ